MASHREAIQGVLHKEDGTLAVTDAHRLYVAYNTPGVRENAVKSVSGKVLDVVFPEVSRLIPDLDSATKTAQIIVKEFHHAVDHIYSVAKLVSNPPILGISLNKVSYTGSNTKDLMDTSLTAQYSVQLEIGDNELHVNAKYMLDALKMFKSEKEDEVTLYFFGKVRPFVLVNRSRDLLALILPVRKF